MEESIQKIVSELQKTTPYFDLEKDPIEESVRIIRLLQFNLELLRSQKHEVCDEL
jgi:predicted secreted Zn-dependent protease